MKAAIYTMLWFLKGFIRTPGLESAPLRKPGEATMKHFRLFQFPNRRAESPNVLGSMPNAVRKLAFVSPHLTQ